MRDISPLGRLQYFRTLDFHDTPVDDISALADLGEVEYLNIENTNIKDLSALATCRELIHSTYLSSLKAPTSRDRFGLHYRNTPIAKLPPFCDFVLLPQPAATIETINHLRTLRSLQPIIPDGYSRANYPTFDTTDHVDVDLPSLKLPSPFDFYVSPSGQIDLKPGSASTPVFTAERDPSKLLNRLQTSRELGQDLVRNLRDGKYQARMEYQDSLNNYLERLPANESSGNILLADATARIIRSMFECDVACLAPGFAAQLKVFLEQHIGLRVFYPELAEFYRDVQAGQITTPLPADAVSGIMKAIDENTPEIFSPKVSSTLKESGDPIVSPQVEEEKEKLAAGPEQPVPPKDPLGDIDPEKARDYATAAWTARLWKLLKEGERVGKIVDGWMKAYDALKPYIRIIQDWYSGSSPPPPPSPGIFV